MKTSIKRLASIALVLVFALLTLALILPNLPIVFSAEEVNSYTGFLQIWHIETFEGGSASRAGWLKRRATEFEKMNKGLLTHVTTYTSAQAQQKLENGEKFDIISFSYGAGNFLLPYLSVFSGSMFGIFDNFLDSADVSDAPFAVPYMTGIYGLFAREGDLQKLGFSEIQKNLQNLSYQKKVGKNVLEMKALGVGFAEFNSPLTTLNNAKSLDMLLDYNTTQYLAYQKFVSNNSFVALLGTQRDLYRLKNRMQQGKIEQLVFEPLDTFCDLVQFAAVSKTSTNKEIATKLIEYLLSQKAQKKLSEISMFSVVTGLYSDEWYIAAESAVPNCFVPNVWTSQEILQKMRSDALQK